MQMRNFGGIEFCFLNGPANFFPTGGTMRILLSVLMTMSLSAFAKGTKEAVDLKDPSILGKYEITKATGEETLDEAELRYNEDNKLTLYYNNNEYELTGPDEKGIVYDGDDEPNCDGDEQSCMYDSHITIWLKTDARDDVPKIEVELTTDDAFDESGKSLATNNYKLRWTKKLANAIPYFTNASDPKELKALMEECAKIAGPEVGHALGNDKLICTINSTFKYRTPEKAAINALIKYYSGNNKKVKKMSPAQLKAKVFAKNEAKIKELDRKELKGSLKDLLVQARKVQNLILKYSDLIYAEDRGPSAVVYSVNRAAKTVVVYQIDIPYKP